MLFKEKKYRFYMVGYCHAIIKHQTLEIEENRKYSETLWKDGQRLLRERH